MTNSIVTVGVTQIVAPTPETLQETGALASQGGTALAVNANALLTKLSDLTPLLVPPITLTSLSWSGGVATATIATIAISSGTYNATTGLVTLTLATPTTIAPGAPLLVSGATGTGAFANINGTFTAAAGTNGTAVTYFVAAALTMTITGGTFNPFAVEAAATFLTTIAGATPANYNGTYLATRASATTFTYNLVSDGGTTPATGTITYTPRGVVELQLMATTYFAQGSQVGVYVLELGPGTPAQGVTALAAYLVLNPNSNYEPGATGFFYAYLLPRLWSSESTYLTLVAQYEATTAKTYFFTTMLLSNYTTFTNLMKSVWGLIEAPGVFLTEYSCAATFYQFLVNAPSTTNRVAQFAFRFLFGVTPYPIYGNSALLATLKAAKVNVVGTGSEGGISTAIIKWGTTMDGRQATYWYSVDWLQLNVDINIANAVINGSQNGPNPLYYNQEGINRLQLVGANTLSRSIAYGLGLSGATVATPELAQNDFNLALNSGAYDGQLVINAIPFLDYVSENPSDYANETYNGFEVVYITQNGFIAIRFNVTVTDFVTQG